LLTYLPGLAHALVDGLDWYWLAETKMQDADPPERVRLLAPFDPVVCDRARFQKLWGWEYRFEAYTPPEQRQRGYYALPLLWRDRVIAWANLSAKNGALASELGYVKSPPRASAFRGALKAELDRIRAFLGLES
jgi:uncharacterized protein